MMQSALPSPRPSASNANSQTLLIDIDRSLERLTGHFQQFILEERRHHQRSLPSFSVLHHDRIAELEAKRINELKRREEQKFRSETRWRESTRPGGPRIYVIRDLERGGYPRHKQLTQLLYTY